jgi:hypothetical protein
MASGLGAGAGGPGLAGLVLGGVPTGTDGTPVAEDFGAVVVVVLLGAAVVVLDVVVDFGTVVVVEAAGAVVVVVVLGVVSAVAVGTATTLASATEPTTAHIVTMVRRKRTTGTSNLSVSGFLAGAAQSLPRVRRPSDAKLSKVQSALGLVLSHPSPGPGIVSWFDRVGAGPATDRWIAAFDQRVDRDVVIRDIATHI